MRFHRVALTLLSAATVACGGGEEAGEPAPMATCSHGPNLVLSSSAVIVDAAGVPLLPNPNGGGVGGFVLLSPVAASPDGSRVAVTWTTHDPNSFGGTGHVVIARVGEGSISATTSAAGPAGAAAVFDGVGFSLVGASVPSTPNDVSSLQLQRFSVEGTATTALQTVEALPGHGFVTSAAWTSRGVAVAWFTEAPEGTATHVQLVGAEGQVEEDLAFDPTVVDETTALMTTGYPTVGLFGGQVVVAHGYEISSLAWRGGTPQTTDTSFTIFVPMKTFPTLFESDGKLFAWGSSSSGGVGLYAGVPGAPFTRVSNVASSTVSQQSDGCGGAVTLSNRNSTLEVVSDTSPGRTISVGTTLSTADNVAAMTATASGIAVTWVGADGIHLTTLAWR